jgi:uncharacterized protein YndB with AHSA1/START domain
MGFVSSYVFNRRALHPKRSNILPLLMSFTLMGGSMLLFALEGVMCLAMALIPALITGSVGALLGAEIARRQGLRRQQMVILLTCLPILTGLEAVNLDIPLQRVTTTLEVDAPPEKVWSHLIAFSELPEPARWVFKLGIAYPMRARIEGAGVGAIRNCEFSTGPFVEPITVWKPGKHLAFDVIEQPEPMTETSPYQRVNAPHLLNGFRSRRGEFRLTALPNNRTRLEGTTWYTLELFPQLYWTTWSDQIIHAIHTRVLEHIRREAEANSSAANSRPPRPTWGSFALIQANFNGMPCQLNRSMQHFA